MLPPEYPLVGHSAIYIRYQPVSAYLPAFYQERIGCIYIYRNVVLPGIHNMAIKPVVIKKTDACFASASLIRTGHQLIIYRNRRTLTCDIYCVEVN